MSFFESLHPEMRELLIKEGISRPTAAQIKSFDHIISGQHTLIIAPTGIGKTEAAVIPVFEHLLEIRGNGELEPGFKVIYTTPLRALNRDMIARLKGWGNALGISVGLRHGDTPRTERTRQSLKPPDFLITTPETLQILFTGSRLIEHLRQVRFVVVDEIHDICPNDRGAQLSVVLERLEEISRHKVVRIGLSATIGFTSILEVGNFLGGMGRKVKVVNVAEEENTSIEVITPSVDHDAMDLAVELSCSHEEMASIVSSRDLIERYSPVLFFVNTRQTAEMLTSRIGMMKGEFPLGIHHGSLAKEVRMTMEKEFKSKRLNGLVCTSSLELGIDVGFVDHVIQFSSPREVTRLIQRVGRAGHGVGRTSRGTILATRNDDIMESGVIARRALAGELEPIKIPKNPLAVLANQIMGACMVKGEGARLIKGSKFYDNIKRSYVFRDLPRDTFYRLLRELDGMYLLNYDPVDDILTRKRKTMKYFYDNISMIRDEKIFRVIDIASRRPVGTLDEGFVTVHLEPMVKFIVKGQAWVVVEIEKDTVIAASSDDIGAIPSWIGEDIPVPYEVAREVGEVRDGISAALNDRKTDMAVWGERLREKYRLSERGWERYLAYIRKQIKDHSLPTHRTISIEREGDTMVINTCLGTRTNDTLALILSSLAASRLGRGVETTTDAYRIILEIPVTHSTKEIRKYLYEIPPGEVRALLAVMVKNSSLLKWTLLYVGKKFGAIRKDADVKSINLDYMVDGYRDSLMYSETVRRVFQGYLDVENTEKVLEGIQSGEIEVVMGNDLSPMAMEGLESRMTLIRPSKADSTVLAALKARLLRYPVIFVCMHCHTSMHKLPRDMHDRKQLVCGNCGGTYLAMLRDYEYELIDLIKKDRKKLKPGEKKRLDRLYANASLISEYRKRGVMALMGRGIGPTRAARILPIPFTMEEDFLREILRAEVEYARTRRFWD